jgi:hypothetical protein
METMASTLEENLVRRAWGLGGLGGGGGLGEVGGGGLVCLGTYVVAHVCHMFVNAASVSALGQR